jgi:aspartyl protease family protein
MTHCRTGALRALFVAAALIAPAAAPASADVEVIALFKDRAVLRSAGGETLLRVGESSPDGVTLLAADAQSARVRYQGREQTLALSARAVAPSVSAAPARITIAPDAYGQYRIGGTVNGRPAEFIVDTGASVVVMNSAHARALGVPFEQGRQGTVQTAQGNAAAYMVVLDSIAVAGIESRSVKAAVVEGGFPVDMLLGMSFLRDAVIESRDGLLTVGRRY